MVVEKKLTIRKEQQVQLIAFLVVWLDRPISRKAWRSDIAALKGAFYVVPT